MRRRSLFAAALAAMGGALVPSALAAQPKAAMTAAGWNGLCTKDDPLGQYGSISYVYYFRRLLTHQEMMVLFTSGAALYTSTARIAADGAS